MKELFLLACIGYITVFNIVLLIASFTGNQFLKKRLFYFIICEAICIGYICYCIEPDKGLDIAGYYDAVNFFKVHKWKDVLLYMGLDRDRMSGNLFDFLLFLIAKTNNEYLLSFIVVYVYYVIVGYLILDSDCDETISGFKVLYSRLLNFVLTMLVFNIFGLRFPLAIALLSFVFHKEDQEKIRRLPIRILLYALLLFIHIGLLPIIVLRLAYPLYKNKNAVLAVFLLIWSFLGVGIANLIMLIPSNKIYSIGFKLNYYLTDLKDAWDFSLTYGAFIILIYIFVLAVKKRELNDFEESNRVFIFMLMFVIGSLQSRQLFSRYIYAIAIYGTSHVLRLTNVNNDNSFRKCSLESAILLFLMIIEAILQIRMTCKVYLPLISWDL